TRSSLGCVDSLCSRILPAGQARSLPHGAARLYGVRPMSRRVLPLLLSLLMAPAATLLAQAPTSPQQGAGQGYQGPPGGQQYSGQQIASPANFGQPGAQPFSGPTQPVVPNTPA